MDDRKGIAPVRTYFISQK